MYIRHLYYTRGMMRRPPETARLLQGKPPYYGISAYLKQPYYKQSSIYYNNITVCVMSFSLLYSQAHSFCGTAQHSCAQEIVVLNSSKCCINQGFIWLTAACKHASNKQLITKPSWVPRPMTEKMGEITTK